MSQEYTPVVWVDEAEGTVGTLINKARLDQMQTAHHYADGFEEVDTIPTADPGVDYHKIVYCTADKQFYRWTGTAWEKDIDDDTKALLLAHEADHANPHQVTKAQVGLGNCDNTSDADKPVSTAQQTALDAKLDDTQLITSWGAGDASATDSNIPSAKLTKDTLNNKVDDTQIVSAWQDTPDNDHIPTEKLTKDTIDGVDASAVHKAGAETITGAKTITGDITIGTAGTPTDVNMLGDLTIQGDITQNGSAYETHAEQIFTTKDYITMREGATGALSPGDYSGLEIVKYDGTNNGRLVVDASGTARVGDVGDEQPLLTRDESADLTDGDLLQWDATGQKAIGKDINTLPFTKHAYNTNSDNTTSVPPASTVQITNASITIPAGINIINVSMSVSMSANAYVLIGIGGNLNTWRNNAFSSSSGEMAISGSYIISNNAPLTICPMVNHRGSASVTPNVSISAVTLN